MEKAFGCIVAGLIVALSLASSAGIVWLLFEAASWLSRQ